MENKFRIGSLEHGRHFSFIHVCGSLSVASREPSVVTLTQHDTPVCVSCAQWELEDVVAYHQVLIWLLAVTTVRSPTGFPTCFTILPSTSVAVAGVTVGSVVCARPADDTLCLRVNAEKRLKHRCKQSAPLPTVIGRHKNKESEWNVLFSLNWAVVSEWELLFHIYCFSNENSKSKSLSACWIIQ